MKLDRLIVWTLKLYGGVLGSGLGIKKMNNCKDRNNGMDLFIVGWRDMSVSRDQ